MFPSRAERVNSYRKAFVPLGENLSFTSREGQRKDFVSLGDKPRGSTLTGRTLFPKQQVFPSRAERVIFSLCKMAEMVEGFPFNSKAYLVQPLASSIACIFIHFY